MKADITTKKRFSEVLINYFISICATVVMFGVAEICLHVFNIPNTEGYIAPNIIPHRKYHHFHMPNSTYTELRKYKNGEVVNIESNYNSNGLRDLPLLGGDVPRVIFLGDSFIEARQVKLDEMFGNIIEKKLSGKVDIINVGCSSWSGFVYYNWLRENLSRYQNVAAVYYFYFPNDSHDAAVFLEDADDPSDLENITFNRFYEKNFKTFQFIRGWLYQHSKIYFMLIQAKNKIKRSLKKEKNIEPSVIGIDSLDHFETLFNGIHSASQKEGLAKDDYCLMKVKELLASKGIDLKVVLIPIAPSISPIEATNEFYSQELKSIIYSSNFFQSRLQRMALEAKFDFIDLTNSLREFKKNHLSESMYLNDGHFSVLGHEAVAEALLPVIKRQFGL